MRSACLLLLALPACAGPGEIQDGVHELSVPLVAGASAGAATLNPIVGGVVAIVTWVAELFIPDGEVARDEVQQEAAAAGEEERMKTMLDWLKANGVLTRAELQASQEDVAAQLAANAATRAAEAAKEKQGIIEEIKGFVWWVIQWAIGLALLWVVGGFLIRRYIQKKNITPLDSLLKDAGQGEKLAEKLQALVDSDG